MVRETPGYLRTCYLKTPRKSETFRALMLMHLPLHHAMNQLLRIKLLVEAMQPVYIPLRLRTHSP